MILRRLALALSLLVIASPVQAGTWRTVQPIGKPRAVEVKGDGLAVRFDPVTRIVGAGEDQDAMAATRVTVTYPGLPPYEVPDDATRIDVHGVSVGIGRLMRGQAAASVVLEGYSGGAHCCATFQLVTLVEGRPVTLALEGIDGSPGRRFPRDIDGDGTVDFVRQDDRFRYQFTDGAHSWSPPEVWNLVGGTLQDVTAAPRYARFLGAFAARMLRECHSPRMGRNGACAAHAAAMARMGRGEEGIGNAVRHAEASDWLPEACTVPLEGEACPEGKERRFAGFEEALRWFLKEEGYF